MRNVGRIYRIQARALGAGLGALGSYPEAWKTSIFTRQLANKHVHYWISEQPGGSDVRDAG